MPFDTNRNSRGDKSKKAAPKSASDSASKPKRFKTERSDSSNSTTNKRFSGEKGRPFPKASKSGEDSTKRFEKSRRDDSPDSGNKDRQPARTRSQSPAGNGDKRFSKDKAGFKGDVKPSGRYGKPDTGKPYKKDFKAPVKRDFSAGERKWTSEERLETKHTSNRGKKPASDNGLIRLNRYISNAGICSRRKADELIQAGVITVNGEAVTELGTKVNPLKDLIRYNGETLKREKMIYVLLNKPKDYITTTDDPQERKTVMQLVDKASSERIYPVGRLDRNTTGLLLLTNDGELTDKLSHPKNSVTKIYQVELSKSLTQGDLNKIAYGLELEDGVIKPDDVSYVQGGTKREIGIQIHSGKNRIVRRIFEHLGYEVVKLDRVIYANLTKKDLPRGRWRYLEEKEIIQLKHLIK